MHPTTDLLNRADRAILHGAVCRVVFCEFSGVVLDERNAVLVYGRGITRRVLAANVWDEHAENVLTALDALGIQAEVYDGRDIFA